MNDVGHVMVVGNFDGVHRGHARLFHEARRIADARGGDVVAMSFRTHPLTLLKPEMAPPILQRLSQRAAAMRAAGADEIVWLDPSADLLGLSPEDFVDRVTEKYHPIGFVEGRNFRFGKNRAGTPQTLVELGKSRGFDVTVVDLLRVPLRDKTVAPLSSSFVRWLVTEGRVADAGMCLGRPFALLGDVVKGDQRGRAIGFPTANLHVHEQMLPADGVYAGTVTIDGERHAAAVSIGVKPTFDGRQRVCEAHVLGYEGDLYGRPIEVGLVRWVRDQQPFPDVDALKKQLAWDVGEVARLFEKGLLDPAALACEPDMEVTA